MTYGLACFMLEYFSLEGREISSNPSTMRTLTTSASGQVASCHLLLALIHSLKPAEINVIHKLPLPTGVKVVVTP